MSSAAGRFSGRRLGVSGLFALGRLALPEDFPGVFATTPIRSGQGKAGGNTHESPRASAQPAQVAGFATCMRRLPSD